jgi:hypothetical protein
MTNTEEIKTKKNNRNPKNLRQKSCSVKLRHNIIFFLAKTKMQKGKAQESKEKIKFWFLAS